MNKEDRDRFVEAAILFLLKRDQDNDGIGLTTEELYEQVNNLSFEDELEVVQISERLKEAIGDD